MNYHIIWATIRPNMFIQCFNDWYDKCVCKENIYLYLAVSKKEHIDHIKIYLKDKVDCSKVKMIMTPDSIIGVTYPTYMLCRYLNVTNCNDTDVVILGSDDFYAPKEWDKILEQEFSNYDGCIIFNDLNPNFSYSVVQIPIMTYRTLKLMNGIIYNPVYSHFWSDNELHDILKELNKIKNISKEKPHIVFEHRHHTTGKRKFDDSDLVVRNRHSDDGSIYHSRIGLNAYQKTASINKSYIPKRLISFSLYGTDEKYLNGAIENAKLQRIIYPTWSCRFYVSDDVPQRTLDQLKYFGCEIINKGNPDGNMGLYWRMEAFMDDSVEVCIIRDCDSRLNFREAFAVNEWLKSDKKFHIMRDHPSGHNSQIMVGMCGAKKGFMNDFKQKYYEWFNQYNPYSHTSTQQRGKHFFGDQIFANNIIWPNIITNHMAHDDYFKFTGQEKNFVFRYPNNLFVGQRFDKDNQPVWE